MTRKKAGDYVHEWEIYSGNVLPGGLKQDLIDLLLFAFFQEREQHRSVSRKRT